MVVMPSHTYVHAKRGILLLTTPVSKRMSKRIICGNLVATQHLTFVSNARPSRRETAPIFSKLHASLSAEPRKLGITIKQSPSDGLCFILIERVCSLKSYESDDARVPQLKCEKTLKDHVKSSECSRNLQSPF